ncbi:mevalonate kinase-like [Glandiceps talaboti]
MNSSPSKRSLIISAPGKVILHGEHAVVYGKVALAVSLNLRTFVELNATDECMIHLDLPDIQLCKSWNPDDINKTFGSTREGNLLHPSPPTPEELTSLKDFGGISEDCTVKDLAVISFLYLYTGIVLHTRKSDLPSLTLRVVSKLPTGAGLGSSAAFSVCLAASLLTYTGVVQTDNDGSGGYYESWNQEQLKLINKWAFEAERIIHGTPSGIDNSISTYGGAIHFQKVTDQDGKITPHIVPLERVPLLRILLVNTKVPRSTKTMVANVRSKYEQFPEIIAPVLDSIEAIATRCQSLFSKMAKDQSHEIIQELEELIDINQHHLAVLGVSHDALEQVCRISSKYKLHSKLTGAGGGGCAVTLLRQDTQESTINAIQQELQVLGFECLPTTIGGRGVTRHTDIHQEMCDNPNSSGIPTTFQRVL